MAKNSFGRRLWNAIQDFWVAIGIFIGIIFGVYDILARFTNWGLISANWVLPTGVILFFVSGIFAIIKYRMKERKLEVEKTETASRSEIHQKIKAESKNQSGGLTAGNVFIFGNDKKFDTVTLEKQDEIIRLMSRAMHDASLWVNSSFSDDWANLSFRYNTALQSGKAFHEYFDGHRHYFSADVLKLLDELDQLLYTSIDLMLLALRKGSEKSLVFLPKSYHLRCEELREQIIEDFRKGLA
jgi:hypothetical protein